MITRIRGRRPSRWVARASFLAAAVALINLSSSRAFQPAALSFPPPPRLTQTQRQVDSPRLSTAIRAASRRRRISILAAQAAATPPASLAEDAADVGKRKGNDTIYSDLHLLKRHRTSKDVETAVVQLGRRGKTDEALRLYRAVWTLDGLRQRLKAQQQQTSGTQPTDQSDLAELTPEFVQFASKSKVRPTTRLMNSAIDACARSHPPARQSEAFEIFQRATSPLNEDGSKKPGGALSPNVFTFGSLLACCARNGDVDKSLELLKVLEEGEEYPDAVPNGVVYSTVISACERAAEPRVDVALEVLNRGILNLSANGDGQKKKMGGIMGVVGYNAAISTLARAAEWRRAVQLLGEMILHCSPSKLSEKSSENLSRSNPWFEPLESIREDMKAAPLLKVVTENEDVVVPEPDEVSFGTVLAACERSGEWEELLHVAKAATEYGVGLDGMALTSALHACQQLGLADEALQYLERMKGLADDADEEGTKTQGRRRRGKRPLRGPDGVAYRLAISACARAPGGHRWRDGIHILDEMRLAAARSNRTDCAPDVVAYTAAIAGCSEAGEYAEAMRLIATMRGEGIRPNVVTFSAVINACASASAKVASRRRDEEAEYLGGNGNDEGAEVEDDVRAPMNRALRLLELMKAPGSSVRPNIVTYNAAIRACAEGLNLDGAFDLLRQLEEDGLEPTIVTYGSLMTACERVGDVEAASRVFRMVKEQGLRANEIVYGAAISCCRRARQPERALLLLRKMMSEELAPNAATFNTVIAALAEGGRRQAERPGSSTDAGDGQLWEKALAVYRVLRSKRAPPGVAPNRQTYNILVRCLASGLNPGHAEAVLRDMREAGYVPDVDLYTMTVRSYERCGSPMKALGLMEAMREVGYDFYGIKVFDEAFKSGVRILNKVGRGLSSGDGVVGVSYAMGEELMDFGDDDEGEGEEFH